ncbi:MAG: hypothetical protein ACUVQ1_05105 [Candidatus Kapaibacteriales bacterium]
MKQFFFVIILLFQSIGLNSINYLPETNFEIFNKLSLQFIDYFENEIRSSYPQHDSIINFSILKNSYSPYFETILVAELSKKGWRIRSYELDNSIDTSTYYTFAIFSFDIYYKILKEDKVERNIIIDFRCTENHPTSYLRPINKDITFSDTIPEELINYIEKEGSPFNAPKPKDEATILEKFIEPIAIIGASALVILLFFSIRSN